MDHTAFIGLSIDRLAHSSEVGRLAAKLSCKVFGWNKTICHQMFLLGLVHDCGYEFVDDPLDHPIVGAALLKEAGYAHWREVRWHGIPNALYHSNELLVLNTADLLVSKEGRRVTLKQRLGDIEQRYGINSEQLSRAKQLISEIEDLLREQGTSFKVIESL